MDGSTDWSVSGGNESGYGVDGVATGEENETVVASSARVCLVL